MTFVPRHARGLERVTQDRVQHAADGAAIGVDAPAPGERGHVREEDRAVLARPARLVGFGGHRELVEHGPVLGKPLVDLALHHVQHPRVPFQERREIGCRHHQRPHPGERDTARRARLHLQGGPLPDDLAGPADRDLATAPAPGHGDPYLPGADDIDVPGRVALTEQRLPRRERLRMRHRQQRRPLLRGQRGPEAAGARVLTLRTCRLTRTAAFLAGDRDPVVTARAHPGDRTAGARVTVRAADRGRRGIGEWPGERRGVGVLERHHLRNRCREPAPGVGQHHLVAGEGDDRRADHHQKPGEHAAERAADRVSEQQARDRRNDGNSRVEHAVGAYAPAGEVPLARPDVRQARVRCLFRVGRRVHDSPFHIAATSPRHALIFGRSASFGPESSSMAYLRQNAHEVENSDPRGSATLPRPLLTARLPGVR